MYVNIFRESNVSQKFNSNFGIQAPAKIIIEIARKCYDNIYQRHYGKQFTLRMPVYENLNKTYTSS